MALNNSCRNLPAEHKVIEPEMLKILSAAEGMCQMNSLMAAMAPNDLPAILRKESVYCALGRLSRSLSGFGGIDFNALLHGIGSWLGQGIPL
jgi:hypothetical protein